MRLTWGLKALRKGRPVAEGDHVTFTNRELLPLLSEMRDFIQQLEEGSNESDIVLMTLVDGTLVPAWSTPRARVLHLTASELVDGAVNFELASRIHLYLDEDAALVISPPALTARDEDEGITGSSAHCTLRITNAGGFNVTGWTGVDFKGTTPSLSSMTEGQRWYFSLYADGTDGTMDCINSGPIG